MSNLHYSALGEIATLDGIKISIVESMLSGGRRLHIAELFKKNDYVATDMGGKTQTFTIRFALYQEQDEASLFDRGMRMRKALNSGKKLQFVDPNYGKLSVMAGEYTVSDVYNKLTFDVSLTIIPLPRPILGMDHFQNISDRVKAVVDRARNALVVIHKEVTSIQRSVDELARATQQFVNNFQQLKAIVSNPSVISKKFDSFEKGLANLGEETLDHFLDGLRAQADEQEDDGIMLIPGNITESFKRMVRGINVKSDVSSILTSVIGSVVVQTLVEAPEKTLKDLNAANTFLLEIDDRIREYLPLDCLESFREMRLAFSQMIVDDVFGVANQKIIPAQDYPVIVSYYMERIKNDFPLKGFYRLNIFNQNIDYFFGEENQELVIESN